MGKQSRTFIVYRRESQFLDGHWMMVQGDVVGTVLARSKTEAARLGRERFGRGTYDAQDKAEHDAWVAAAPERERKAAERIARFGASRGAT
jgi:hypothetical protein